MDTKLSCMKKFSAAQRTRLYCYGIETLEEWLSRCAGPGRSAFAKLLAMDEKELDAAIEEARSLISGEFQPPKKKRR